MKTAIVLIIKNKTGDSSDKGNYRPIALVKVCSKIYKICLLEMLEIYLEFDDHQFGFKSQHARDMCISTVKEVIKYYIKQNSSVFTCFLDTAKGFDRVSHWTLFSKLIQRNYLLVIVRIIAFRYQTQPNYYCILAWRGTINNDNLFHVLQKKAPIRITLLILNQSIKIDDCQYSWVLHCCKCIFIVL